MSIYIVADLKFNDKESKEKWGSLENYNNHLVEQWNSVVNNDDTVFVFGEFFCQRIGVYSIVKKLNGKIVLTKVKNNNLYNAKQWGEMGISCVVGSYTYQNIAFPYSKTQLPFKCVCEDDEDYVKEIFENGKLNISAKNWDYCPLELDSIAEIIERMDDFEKEEIKNGKQC